VNGSILTFFAAAIFLRFFPYYSGNIQFRALVRNNKQRYLDKDDKNDKVVVAREVIDMVVESGGRFLELAGADVMTGPWKHAVFAKCLDKTWQALRDNRWNSSSSTTPSPRPERLIPVEGPESVRASNSSRKLSSSSRSPSTNANVGSDESSPSESVKEHLEEHASPSALTQQQMASQVEASEMIYGGSKTAEERMSILSEGSRVAIYWRKFCLSVLFRPVAVLPCLI
jgi:hypothetical protein